MAKADQRDVLAELGSIEDYLSGLIGGNPLPGQDSNRQRLAGEFVAVRELAQNIVELAAEYNSGVTHIQRLEGSMGVRLTEDQVRHLGLSGEASNAQQEEIDRLRLQVAELQAAQGGLSNG